jgi:ParB family transcriptional regulator, chromosome partitioning protein
MTQTCTIAELRPGHEYPGGNINARTYESDAVAGRAESLMAFGQLQSLTVCPAPGKSGPPFYVAAGGLRLAAFQRLVKEKRLPADHAIDISIKPDWDGATALAASIEENRERIPLHPVNEYEQFAELIVRGKTVADICSMYGMPEREALGILALGQAHPEIRAAFRDGKIKAEVFKAFTISPDQKRQLAVFKKLSNGRYMYADHVRSALVGNDEDCGPLIAYIGKYVYEQAGGKVMEDLFGEKHGVSDPALAKKLADEKMAGDKERLIAEGWAWAALSEELPSMYRHAWARIEAKPDYTPEERKRLAEIDKRTKEINDLDEAGGADFETYDEDQRLDEERDAIKAAGALRGFTAKQKAKAGVVLTLDGAGRLVVNAGFVKPSEVKNVAAKELDVDTRQKVQKKKAAAGLSNALAMRLSETLTVATAAALAKDPKVAIPALIAGFTGMESSVKVSENGIRTDQRKKGHYDGKGNFVSAFEVLLKAPPARQTEALCAITADALDFKIHSADRKPLKDKPVTVLIDALDGKSVNAELRRCFMAKDYFEGISKAMCFAAITEALGDGYKGSNLTASSKSAEVAKFAIANVPKTGWLPPELRTSHYDGPGAKAAPAKAKAKKKAR